MRVVLGLLGSTAWLMIELSAATARDGDPVNGRRLFLQENCYGCHGGRGGGGMGPNLRDERPDEDDAAKVIRNGTRTGMPPYRGRLTNRDIQDLIAYIERLRRDDEPVFTHWWEIPPPTRRRERPRRDDD
jgi:cytochrome c oxidase cbb3-type subunit 3